MFSEKDSLKKTIAKEIFKNAHSTRKGIISYQVVQEFCNVALRKFDTPLSLEECKNFINRFMFPICAIHSNNDIFNTALDIKLESKYSFYDSLILSAAYKTDCKIIYSEDLSSGQKIKTMEIINPFR
jgi:predicted nucleic acid-binding protein